jgi:hypothetical protein
LGVAETDFAGHRVRIETTEDRETIESAVAEGGLRAELTNAGR